MSQAKSIQVLIAEDHAIVRDGLVTIINRAEDMSVVAEANNGQEAIELYRQHQPHITLMDLRMPILEGVDAIQQIRSLDSTARIIILTTYDTDEDIYRGLQAGASGYLLKDTTSAELLNAIRQVHAGKKYIPAQVAMKLTDRIQGDELTVRELEVLTLITQGKSNQTIGADLSISEGTVKFHIKNILQKLGVSDRTQAVVTALKRGLTRIE
jgi:two-component system, NarL family, response regulator